MGDILTYCMLTANNHDITIIKDRRELQLLIGLMVA